MKLNFACDLILGFVWLFFLKSQHLPRESLISFATMEDVLKIKPTAIYVLGALGLFVISSVKISTCAQDSCCSKTQGAFRHPCIVLILIPSCGDPLEPAHDNRSKLYFRVGKRCINVILSSPSAIP